MKKIIFALLFSMNIFWVSAQQADQVAALRKKIDSLEQRLDEKNYTRVPNTAIDEELDKKVKENVSEWFDRNKWVNGSIFGGLIMVVGLFILTIGRKWMTRELNDSLKKEVADKAKDLQEKFQEHKDSVKESIKELKETITIRLDELKKNIERSDNDTQAYIEKYRDELNGNIEEVTQKKFQSLDQSNKEIQTEMNEALDQLFAQTVESISENAQKLRKADPKAEEQIKFVLKRLRQGDIQNEVLATQALESIIQYYFYSLKTDKMIDLIKEYQNVYSLSNTIYANAALAFLDKYERSFQPSNRNSCLEYCEESIKKTYDYGTAYAVKLEAYLIDMAKGYDQPVKDEAAKEIDKILHQIINIRSKYIHKEIIDRLDQDATKYMGTYIPQLEKNFSDQMKTIREKAYPPPVEPLPIDPPKTS